MLLYIVRHADPDYSRDSITPAGHLEAQALAVRMEKLRPHRLYCSPLGRAIDTARYTAERLGMKLEIEPWTAEIDEWWIEQDVLGRSTLWDLHGETIRRITPPMSTADWYLRSPFCDLNCRERFEQLVRASDEFLARHGYVREGPVYRVERPNRERIVVFCHGGFGLTWLAHLLEIPLPLMYAGFHLRPSSVTTILFDERHPDVATPRCIGLADVSHLYAAGLPVSTHGIKANVE